MVTDNNSSISRIDLGLPLETQVLSHFFDNDFAPSDYINALCATSLMSVSQPNNAISNKSVQLNSASSLKLLYQRCFALSLHLNEYTNELAKRFDQSYETLVTSSSQIISYDSNITSDLTKSKKDNGENESDEEVNDDSLVTRLQYHIATLNTSMYSLVDDIKQTRQSLDELDPIKKDGNDLMSKLQNLKITKENINSVKKSFGLLKSLVASSEITDENSNIEDLETNNKIQVEELQNALTVLRNLINEQVIKEIDLLKKSKEDDTPIETNEKLVKIIDNMIELQPIFQSFTKFNVVYTSFVDFLKIKKNMYLNAIE